MKHSYHLRTTRLQLLNDLHTGQQLLFGAFQFAYFLKLHFEPIDFILQKLVAVYLVIDNSTEQGDGLIGASSDAANVTEIHLSKMDAQGTMTMERQDLIGIPAGETISLEPGGLHVMLMNLVRDLNVGDKFELTLEFQRAGDVSIEVEVKHVKLKPIIKNNQHFYSLVL